MDPNDTPSLPALQQLPRWRFLPVWQRNALVWRKLALSSLLGNIADPLLQLAAFGLGLGSLIGKVGGMPYLLFLASGTVSMSVMNATSFEGLFSAFTRMHVQRTWDSILLTPTALDDVLLGEMLWAATKGLISGVALVLVVLALGIGHSPAVLLVLPLLALIGMVFAALSLIVTALAKSYDFFTYYFTIVLTPMTFLSGVFFPLGTMPRWLQAVAQVLPLHAAVELVRPLFFGRWDAQAPLHLLILGAYLAGGWWLARRFTQRRFAA